MDSPPASASEARSEASTPTGPTPLSGATPPTAANPPTAPAMATGPTPSSGPWTPGERGRAWAVHGFTALGIVACMLALRDVLTNHPDYAILWLLLTLLIDGIDGPIARALMVSERVPRIDGFTLDLIIDYVACVIVPASFMYEFHVVPQGNVGIAVLCVLVFTSAIWFARRDMMTDDFWFRGFPAAWNMVVPIMFLLDARTWVGTVITLVLSVLSLTNLPFPHIMRAKFLQPVTVLVTVILMGGIIYGTIAYPDHPYVVRPLLYAGCLYFGALAIVKLVTDARRRRMEMAAV
jgi:phosphatidylcholine synthase